VVLINSNPATIMTDPETADRTYIEPITPEIVCKIIERERPDAILPPWRPDRSQLRHRRGRHRHPGALGRGDDRRQPQVIKKAEDRQLFRDAMANIKPAGSPECHCAHHGGDAGSHRCPGLSYHCAPQFHSWGHRGGVAYNLEDLQELTSYGLEASMIHEVMLEESALGWKEFELEVMRDFKDNVVIICSIENLDPMGCIPAIP